jgi:Phasin protein
MAKEDNPRFEIPADMRALAEKSVEQAKQAKEAKQAFEIFVSAAQRAVSNAEHQAVSAQAGAKEVGELAMAFAERSIASSFAFAQKLLQAREAKDVMAASR